MIIWRIVDGRRGHDNQSRGLINALSRHTTCICHDISVSCYRPRLLHFLLRKYPPGESLPKPHIIVGAGHATHLHLLLARRSYGGRTVVIMKPGLPTSLFDFCLIPDHDNPPITDSIIITRGALTAITPGNHHDPEQGLIMIGGPSRHYDWDNKLLLEQIRLILQKTPEIKWSITDSPRTPETTGNLLKNLVATNAGFCSFGSTTPEWISERLQTAGFVWVSEDSMSMIYESITAGAATGLIKVPSLQRGKFTNSIQNLITNSMVTSFEDWKKGRPLTPPEDILDEADRCAEYLLEKIK